MKSTQRNILLTVLVAAIIMFPVYPYVNGQSSPRILDSTTIPKFTSQLTGPPPVYTAKNVTDSQGNLVEQQYTVNVSEFTQQILPAGYPSTTVWGYQGTAHDAVTGANLGTIGGTPGCTFIATQGVPVKVKWVNNLVDSSGNPLKYLLPVDSTIHWANPNGLPMNMGMSGQQSDPAAVSPVPIVTHLHGGEVPSTSDGFPDSWYTPDGKHGPAYTTEEPTDSNAAVYIYPNTQQPSNLWYHDHALGLTRLNVLSGLAGFYLIENNSDPVTKTLPTGAYDVPILIQDRSFYTNGSLYYPTVGSFPEEHPVWNQFFQGNTIVVNGLAWPNMNVEQGFYRFRILDGSNSRFYEIALSNGMSFTQIGSDGGYLKSPVKLTSKLIAPAERIDILVDFSSFPAGTKIVLKDAAIVNAPAATPDPNNQMPNNPAPDDPTGDIMQFTVVDKQGASPPTLPSNLNPTLTGTYPTLPEPDKTRILTLTGMMGDGGSKQLLLDGQDWSAPVSENPQAGTTEDWIIVNPMTEIHPIHLHLIQFQVVSRQKLDSASYMMEWTTLNGDVPLKNATVNVASLQPYLTGSAKPADPTEQGWKDTVIVNSGEVVTIRARWTQQDGSAFPFDASVGPGYVWHCHLLEHEDNEMMRPYTVAASASESNFPVWIIAAVSVAVILAVLAAVVMVFWGRRKRRS